MKESLYFTLSIWLSVIGALIAIIGQVVGEIGSFVKRLGIQIVEHSFKYDL